MQVLHAQGRREAIDRQYVEAPSHFDDRPQSARLRAVYRRLVRRG